MLNTQEQKTLDSLRDTGAFALEWAIREHYEDELGDADEYAWYIELSREWLMDESAYWLMVGRGLKELGELVGSVMWNMDGTVRILLDGVEENERCLYDGTDILAAILAALKGGE